MSDTRVWTLEYCRVDDGSPWEQYKSGVRVPLTMEAAAAIVLKERGHDADLKLSYAYRLRHEITGQLVML